MNFDAANLIDGEPTTAWRTTGDGIGEHVTFTWASPVHLRRIGVIPGYTKVDPVSGTNRFRQNRRVRKALVSFDSGAAGQVDFDPGDPRLQTFDVDAVTRTVTISIQSSTAAPRNFTAMSEIQFWSES